MSMYHNRKISVRLTAQMFADLDYLAKKFKKPWRETSPYGAVIRQLINDAIVADRLAEAAKVKAAADEKAKLTTIPGRRIKMPRGKQHA